MHQRLLFSRWRSPLLVLLIVIGGLLLSTTSVFAQTQGTPHLMQGQGGNDNCPAGTIEVAKFNTDGNSYILEGDNDGNVVITNQDSTGGNWSSDLFIAAIVVKGGPNATIDLVNPPAQSGTFTNVNIPVNGGGNIPDISNIKFCAADPQPEPETFELRMIKYNDLDQDGTNNEINTGAGDPTSGNALTGWEFVVYDSNGNEVGRNTTSEENAGANGDLGIRAGIPGLISGEEYTICETQQSGWINTEPGTINGTYGEPCETVTLTSSTTVTRYFGNYEEAPETGTISVQKYIDGDRDGIFDSQNQADSTGEGWEITVSDENGEVASGSTNETGQIIFEDLPYGTYEVCEEDRDGFSPVGSELCQEVTVPQVQLPLVFLNQPDPEPEDLRLNLTAECAVGDTLYWRVTNNEDVDIDFTVRNRGISGTATANSRTYFTTQDGGGANTTIIDWDNPSGNTDSRTKAHNNNPCVYHVTFDKQWDGADAPDLDGAVLLTAESSLGTATCTSDDGDLSCVYSTGDDLHVPFGETYSVSENLPEGWTVVEGIGEGFTGIAGFDESALPNDLVYDVADDRFCENDPNAEFPFNLEKFCEHTVVNEVEEPPREDVRPILECVAPIANSNMFRAFFGYSNPNDGSVEIPVGADNRFNRADQDQGQPTEFAPGRTPFFPNAAFSVDFDGSNLVWTLDGRTATASDNPAQRCNFYVTLDKVWEGADAPASVHDLITATSASGSASCDWTDGTLVCEYSGNGNMPVPVSIVDGEFEGEYSVSENLPANWTATSGVGDFILPSDNCDGKFCEHTVVNEYEEPLELERLIPDCLSVETDEYRWRVRNPNDEPIDFTLTNPAGDVVFASGTAAPNGDTTVFTSVSETTFPTILRVDGVEQPNGRKNPNVNPCTPPPPEYCATAFAVSVVNFEQGPTKSNGDVQASRSDANNALGEPQDSDSSGQPINFVSLGFGGELVLDFGTYIVPNPDGDDLSILETTYGRQNFERYPEEVDVYGSLFPNGPWTFIGNVGLDGNLELPASLPAMRYIRLVDNSNVFSNRFPGGADGYDVDGVGGCATEDPGTLTVTKTVDTGVFEPEMPDFDICVFAAGDLENALDCRDFEAGESFSWDLPAGDYVVREILDDLPDGWSTEDETTNVSIAWSEESDVEIVNEYILPERPSAEYCVALNEFFSPDRVDTSIQGELIDELIRVYTEDGDAQLVATTGAFAWVANGAGDNYSGGESPDYAIQDRAFRHRYYFTFADDIIVTGFSVRVYDMGDYNPGRARQWFVELSSSETADTDGLSYNANTIGHAGDAFRAEEGQPGNRNYAISGDNLMRVDLDFDFDGNRARTTYNPSRHGQVTNASSADPYIGIDELCITYEEADPSRIIVSKYEDLNEDGRRTWSENEPGIENWEFSITGPDGFEADNQFTGANGYTTFRDLEPGEYQVCEIMQDGWYNTSGNLCQTVVVEEYGETARISFGNARERGDLTIVKDIHWNGVEANNAVNFEICVEGEGCLEANYGNDYTVVFEDLLVGEYTFSETYPGEQWTVSYPYGQTVTVTTEGGMGYVTNTHDAPPQNGDVTIRKTVDWNNVNPDQGQTFMLCLTGGDLDEPLCGQVGYNGGSVTFYDLPAGNYSAYEWNPGEDWTVSGGGNVTVVAGESASTTIHNRRNAPPPPPPTPCEGFGPREWLSGEITIDGRTAHGHVTNNGDEACEFPFGIASYNMPSYDLYWQTVHAHNTTTQVIEPGETVHISVGLPECATQVDLFYGTDVLGLDGVLGEARYGSRMLAFVWLETGNWCEAPDGMPQPQPPVEEQPTQEEPPVEEEPTQEQPPVEELPVEEEPPVEEPTQEEPPVEEPTQEQPPVEEPAGEETTGEETTGEEG